MSNYLNRNVKTQANFLLSMLLYTFQSMKDRTFNSYILKTPGCFTNADPPTVTSNINRQQFIITLDLSSSSKIELFLSSSSSPDLAAAPFTSPLVAPSPSTGSSSIIPKIKILYSSLSYLLYDSNYKLYIHSLHACPLQ